MNDLEYDLLTTLQSKLEALEAYDVYLEDAEQAGDDDAKQLFEQIRRDDEQHASRLREQLARVLNGSPAGG